MPDRQYPNSEILTAFGIRESPVRLSGGEDTSFLAGSIVLKPVDNEGEAVWRAELMAAIVEDGFRIPRPVKTLSGDWLHGSWQAFTFVRGREIKGRWADKLAVSSRFHRALSTIPRPAFIANSTHPWGIADRMAWGDEPLRYGPHLTAVMVRLLPLVKPISLPGQLIHGDMTGNILFDETLPPAIIDLSPYWRPAEYANAIIVVDSVVWEGAPDTLLDFLGNSHEIHQLLVRASMWRIVTTELCIDQFGKGNISDVNSYDHFIDLLYQRIGG